MKQTAEERFARKVDIIRRRTGASLRTLDMKNFDQEVRTFVDIYLESFRDNWSMVDISDDEVKLLAKNLKLVIDPEFFIFAEVDGKPISFIGTVPNVNEVLSLGQGMGARNDFFRLIKLLKKQV